MIIAFAAFQDLVCCRKCALAYPALSGKSQVSLIMFGVRDPRARTIVLAHSAGGSPSANAGDSLHLRGFAGTLDLADPWNALPRMLCTSAFQMRELASRFAGSSRAVQRSSEQSGPSICVTCRRSIQVSIPCRSYREPAMSRRGLAQKISRRQTLRLQASRIAALRC